MLAYTLTMHEIDGENYLTADETIALLGVKRATLYAYVSRGVLQSYRKGVGRERLYRRDEVEKLLAVRADAPSPRQAAEPPAGVPSPQAAVPPAGVPSPLQVAEPRAPYTSDDGTLRNVSLPPAETWAGDH